jgi:hypothetical protein
MIEGKPCRLEEEDFGWMVGRSIAALDFAEPESWWFGFSGGGQVATHGGAWRLFSAERPVISSCGHGQRFGRSEPVDAIAAARNATRDALVVSARVRAGAPDLEVRLSNGLVLEVLALSAGHECWQARDPSGRCVVVHGSRDAATWQEAERPSR